MSENNPGTGRLDALSDGVIAVIITILVLELKAPTARGIAGLVEVLPTVLLYLLTFVQIGIYWVNHHYLVDEAERVTHGMFWANLMFLFCLSLFPFAADLGPQHHITDARKNADCRVEGGREGRKPLHPNPLQNVGTGDEEHPPPILCNQLWFKNPHAAHRCNPPSTSRIRHHIPATRSGLSSVHLSHSGRVECHLKSPSLISSQRTTPPMSLAPTFPATGASTDPGRLRGYPSLFPQPS